MKANAMSSKTAGAGVLAALVATLCCITPVLSLIAGVSGLAAAFYWLEPFRPNLIGVSLLALGFAWRQKLKSRKEEDITCQCEDEEHRITPSSFWQSKKFLSIVTVIALALLFFPTYAHIFFSNTEKQEMIGQQLNLKEVQMNVKGMTCSGCEEHIKHASL